MLRTRNNTDGNKLVIFSGIASYYGDNYILRDSHKYNHMHCCAKGLAIQCLSFWDTINTGPGNRGPGTKGPRFLRAVLDCSSSNTCTTMQAISANATCLTHNYVLYTKGIIYSIQRYSLTSLILRVVYCQFCKARLVHRHDTQSERVWRLFAFDL